MKKWSVITTIISLFLVAGSAWGTIITPSQNITSSASTWTTSVDQNNTITLTTQSDATHGTYLDMAYNLGGGGAWVAADNASMVSVLDLATKGNAFRFYLKGEGLANNFVIKAQLPDGTVFKSKTYSIPTNGAWITQTVLFTDMDYAYGNPLYDEDDFSQHADQTSNIEFTIQPVEGGAGSMAIDDLKVVSYYPDVVITPTPTAVDDAEQANLNNFNSPVGPLGHATVDLVSANPTPIQGTSCRRIIAQNDSADYEDGMYEIIYYNNVSSQAFDATPYTYLSFYVYAQTVPGDIHLDLKQADLSVVQTVTIQDYLADGHWDPNTWELVNIPLSAWPAVNKSQLGQLVFSLPAGYSFYVDAMTFEFKLGPAYMVDNMDTYYTDSSWFFGDSGNDTSTSLESIDGVDNKALRLNFTFPTVLLPSVDYYAYLKRGFSINLKENNADAITFDYKGTGASNNIEFKMTDSQDTIYRFVLQNATNTNGVWKTTFMPYSEFAYFSGKNTTFDFKDLVKIEIAFSKGNGNEGTVGFSNIAYVKKPDFSALIPKTGLIRSFSIDNNPFAPRDDTPRSKATFSYVLSEPNAKVWLNIYDLNGNPIIKLEPAAGDSKIVWNGKNENGYRVRNGMYLYQFVAQGLSKTERVKNIIAVIR